MTTDKQNLDDVFIKPTVPKNSWQLLSWAIFEPVLLSRYSSSLNKKKSVIVFLQTYFWIVLISLVIYLATCFITIAIDAPILFSTQYKSEFVSHYRLLIDFDKKLFFIICESIIDLLTGLVGGVIIGLVIDFIGGVVIGGAIGITLALIVCFNLELIFDFEGGVLIRIVISLSLGLTLGVVYAFPENRLERLSFLYILLIVGWLTLGTFVGGIEYFSGGKFIWGIFEGLGEGIPFLIGLCFSYFRLYLYPFYFFRSLFSVSFYASPYLNDGAIWLPLWKTKKKFCNLALETPETAIAFATFLRTYRPLQTKLADYIVHAAFAGFWLQNPLQVDSLPARRPSFIENEELKPSSNWIEQLKILRTQLISFQQQSNIQLKQQHGLQLVKELEIFKQQTLIENRSWRDYYLKAIDLWLKVANEQLEQLNLQALSHEPITANVYLSGEALNPEMHRAIFLGRDDLKDQFARKVLTAAQMPMFLIQGQRRTGKTSLLNFLEPLLGAGFRVIKQDLQDAKFDSIPNWLIDLQQRISPYLDTPQPEPARSTDWLQSWQTVQACLSQFNGTSHYKLILAFDEYEAIHALLQQDSSQGERLLAAMRSFSQSQNKVVFLFVGAALFSELEQPNWSKHFVQAQRFRVDYLKHDDAIRLITEPVKLNYPPTVYEQMFDLTQGHPALLQLLCSKMVDIANTENKKDMSQADLDAVVQEVSNERETSAILIFWKDFCADPACKQTVKQILNGESVEPNQHLYRLEEHGFIVEQNGRWQMRVPLFTLWLKRFADRVL